MSSQEKLDAKDPMATNLRHWTRYLVRIERGIAVSMLVTIMVTMAAQVFARYALGQPFSWSEELSRLAMIWMSFLSASFVMAEGNHIAVDLWSQRVSANSSQRLQLMSYVVIASSCLMLFFGGWNFVVKVDPVGSATLGIPMSYWYSSVSVGLLLMTFHALINFVLVLRTGKPYCSEFIEPSVESNAHKDTQKGEGLA